MTALAAVVLCAGKGTRMKSEKAKVLHPILGRPLCAYPLKRALELGATHVVPVVGHQAAEVEKSIRSHFPDAPLRFALQKEQKGTADAVKAAQDALKGHDGRVLILYGDVPLLRKETLQSLLAAHDAAGGVLALVSTTLEDPTGYGRVIREGGKVARIVEHKDCTPEQRAVKECNAGIYSVDAAFLWKALAEIKPVNAQGEYYLTDLVEMAAKLGPVGAVDADATETAGVNDKVELAARARVLQQRINEAHMRAGVSIQDPATAYIEEGITIGTDTEIGPSVSLMAGTVIGKNVTIGQGSVLTASHVADGTHIKPYSVLEEARVGERCIIGPFSRLRPATELAEEVHLGNFVETKKARIGKGTKANHLTYLGDANIGAGCNIGAGTITCNYDGVNKHLTELGDGVFIGSDSQLVAPVKVGDGGYVGAGSTVTKNVPPGSLAVSRAPQVVKEGWVAAKKARQVKVKAG
ncbi:bifunctional UDP-N-acetylglucosamine diphosphorylase/glucosamine-1-phosphate N-acetyltransferase GlmU [Corallococcus exiguus]|uniref:bifunctional UDP-N-acetylglucosamine diphosphorylase/glucosamine-1-phosphate N-acetyltransferase GlmU n=1 Tax=Corallococcus TaxID=83461 RepID=UPI000EA36637|nr:MULTISPECIES: bifunctional UDP-N-acetylglucosamine diphosphorylase/glucosamine-1-phosphate N-acetyltransferase GlmU [Corallococcus]NRD56276.1 bifunctional UDP-N-acetylglucosamine diphosphorylase/glucosamine-1-phosphate N-acetyltransferase GlmU [Corallococcus exiguus]NRD65852.1 bifunctional UDP-N-acetylglucosamine diphosphorylase/glucosamine-1-phosphate N-acetyltransferase GlmU [Corallococcus exiguus]RKH26513.1 UDP-N-acetylglucosamine diphosphorylase/glucosamine-1-phosphate N-acetyltransferase